MAPGFQTSAMDLVTLREGGGVKVEGEEVKVGFQSFCGAADCSLTIFL